MSATPTRIYRLDTDALWRLWTKVLTAGEVDGCWAWLGSHNSDNYAKFWLAGRDVLVSRVMCALRHGPFKRGQVALHSCDHSWCVNPMHLAPGTQRRNIRDSWARTRRGAPRTFMEGEVAA